MSSPSQKHSSVPAFVPPMPVDFPEEESGGSKFMRKAKQDPFVPVGITAAVAILGYQAYKFKNRGNTKLSVYLIHTRVAAQSAVIGSMAIGVLYSMYREFIKKDT